MPRRLALLAASSVLFASAAAAAPSTAPAAKPPAVAPTAGPAAGSGATPVVMIIIDTLRADHLACYGAPWRTPAIDGLARDGVLFRHCFATAPITLPSTASIYTGRLPYHHGTITGEYAHLPDAEVTLAERMAEAGYATAGFVSIVFLTERYGLDQGFARLELLDQGPNHRDADSVTRLGTEYAAANAGKPFFLLLHYYDVHSPYAPPAPFDRMYYEGNEKAPGEPVLTFLRSAKNRTDKRNDWNYRWLEGVTDLQFGVRQYAAGVSYADMHVGRVLEALRRAGLYERALIVLCADHGEHLGEHDIWFTHYVPYQEVLHVPLIVKLPGNRQAGLAIEEPVSNLDIAPTILETIGRPAPAEIDGRSLVGVMNGQRSRKPSLVVAEQGNLPTRFSKALVEWPWKLLLFRTGAREVYELYDLSADPAETRDLAAANPAVRQRLRKSLWKLFDRGKPLVADTRSRPVTVDAETDRQLRALGY